MGKIIIDGKDVTRLSEHQRAKYIGRVFQDPMMGTAATMQIDENLALAARRGLARTLKIGITKKEHDEYYELLKTLDLGLENRMTSKVGLLSGGQRQAVTLLMATLKKPKLLLLDEHTAALDPKTAAKVLTLSEKIVEENHLTTLMITHNMKDAIKYGNRLIMMYEGHVSTMCAARKRRTCRSATCCSALSRSATASLPTTECCFPEIEPNFARDVKSRLFACNKIVIRDNFLKTMFKARQI